MVSATSSPSSSRPDSADVERMRFGELTVTFDDQVLRPREWTTAQSEWAADLLTESPEGPVLELCAGVGQIGLLAIACRPRNLLLVDANPRACELARRNAEEAGLGHLVEVRHGRLEHAVRPEEQFVGVIADPPWVPSDEVRHYPEDPTSAIDGGLAGLDIARACIEVAHDHVVDGGWLLMQLGTPSQAEELTEWSRRKGLELEQTELRAFERGVLLRLERHH
jgi:release factor glutamine methyltransferase